MGLLLGHCAQPMKRFDRLSPDKGNDECFVFLVSPPQVELNVTLPGGNGKERTFTVSTLLLHWSLIILSCCMCTLVVSQFLTCTFHLLFVPLPPSLFLSLFPLLSPPILPFPFLLFPSFFHPLPCFLPSPSRSLPSLSIHTFPLPPLTLFPPFPHLVCISTI